MLTISDTAADQLPQLLNNSPDEAVLRLVPDEQGFSMTLSHVQADDTTYEHSGKTLLVMEPAVNEALADKSLDIRNTEKGAQLTLV